MQIVAGNNLNHQWFYDDLIISEFRVITAESLCNLHYSSAELLQINWFYNIVKIQSCFYLIGFVNSEETVRKIKLPDNCDSSNVIVLGNDYKLIVVDKSLCKIWVYNLEDETECKCISLKIEAPEECSVKKKKLEDHICKVSLLNDSILYLTEAGSVYCGLLPCYVDTTHCVGKVIDVQCGYEHFILLTDTGLIYTWGNGRRLQLGHGDISNLEIPTEVEALAGVKIIKICAGGWHSLALSEFGDLYAWGWNDTGQLGITANEKYSCSLPSLVDILDSDTVNTKNVKDIACGSKFSAILLEDKSVWTSGNNNYGQLGISTDIKCITAFRKVYQCTNDSKLMCGPWTTAIIDK
ncbi:hypothetical protein K1T71_003529 [Dendrolimus kikuchii]|uniref:Uncharacterized protein n=1 Tax=Dendrolimus kikuchii TaxID=765133 RepID=A0ACC1DBV4_9NEOP|nr:hypothetical protein K1T71_003529 [Dendrolimus kikuchii]